MEKKNVVIYVAGQRFSITTTDSEEYVIGIGEKVDVMIKGIQKDNPRLNRDACAILAALDLCDDETKLKQMMEVLRTQVKDYLETNEKLREENERLKTQIKEMNVSSGDTAEETEITAKVQSEEEKTEEEIAEEADEEETVSEREEVISASPVLSKSESLVMAEAKESTTRHTAFVGKDFRSGKKGKKNKKHHKQQYTEPATPAPAASTSPAPQADIEEEVAPYHQFSFFDNIE